jgi:ABC-type multidrug transport system ATPase subunit
VHNPRLLLLDEPLGALDALTRIEMHRLIEGLWRASGFTALLVTHDVQEAVALADRVILIEDGRIALDETISLARPRSHGDVAFAAIEKRILDGVLQKPESEPVADAHWLPAHGLRWAMIELAGIVQTYTGASGPVHALRGVENTARQHRRRHRPYGLLPTGLWAGLFAARVPNFHATDAKRTGS